MVAEVGVDVGEQIVYLPLQTAGDGAPFAVDVLDGHAPLDGIDVVAGGVVGGCHEIEHLGVVGVDVVEYAQVVERACMVAKHGVGPGAS